MLSTIQSVINAKEYLENKMDAKVRLGFSTKDYIDYNKKKKEELMKNRLSTIINYRRENNDATIGTTY